MQTNTKPRVARIIDSGAGATLIELTNGRYRVTLRKYAINDEVSPEPNWNHDICDTKFLSAAEHELKHFIG